MKSKLFTLLIPVLFFVILGTSYALLGFKSHPYHVCQTLANTNWKGVVAAKHSRKGYIVEVKINQAKESEEKKGIYHFTGTASFGHKYKDQKMVGSCKKKWSCTSKNCAIFKIKTKNFLITARKNYSSDTTVIPIHLSSGVHDYYGKLSKQQY